MPPSVTDPDAVLKYELEVGDQGRVELNVPFAPGARVVVYVRRENDEDLADLEGPPPKAASVSGTTRSTMRTGTMPNQGDVVLIPIPFTDLSSQKRRPVIVISNDEYSRTAPMSWSSR